MPVHSPLRKRLKTLLRPFIGIAILRLLHGVARAWDIKTGAWREAELDIIPFAVSEGDWAIDVGANYGLYSYHLSRAVGYKGRVLAFEPIPVTFSTLKLVRRLLCLQNVELFQQAAGDRTGHVEMELPIHTSGDPATRLAFRQGRERGRRAGAESTSSIAVTEKVNCEMIALDSLLNTLGPVSFVKIDIEGAEPWALRGLEQVIRQYSPTIVCEVNPVFLAGYGFCPMETIDFLRACGYACFHLRGAAQSMLPVKGSITHAGNYVFVHPRRAQWMRSFEKYATRKKVELV